MIIKAEKTSFPEVIGAVDSFLEKNDCPMKTQFQIDTAVEEIFVNIASYAYPSGEGNADISISLSDDRILCIRFSDNGIPFDPLSKEDPDVTLSAEERKIGGLGIYMVKKMMDKVEYEYKEKCNILTLYKQI